MLLEQYITVNNSKLLLEQYKIVNNSKFMHIIITRVHKSEVSTKPCQVSRVHLGCKLLSSQ